MVDGLWLADVALPTAVCVEGSIPTRLGAIAHYAHLAEHLCTLLDITAKEPASSGDACLITPTPSAELLIAIITFKAKLV